MLSNLPPYTRRSPNLEGNTDKSTDPKTEERELEINNGKTGIKKKKELTQKKWKDLPEIDMSELPEEGSIFPEPIIALT